jgi:hypothetical protein
MMVDAVAGTQPTEQTMIGGLVLMRNVTGSMLGRLTAVANCAEKKGQTLEKLDISRQIQMNIR